MLTDCMVICGSTENPGPRGPTAVCFPFLEEPTVACLRSWQPLPCVLACREVAHMDGLGWHTGPRPALTSSHSSLWPLMEEDCNKTLSEIWRHLIGLSLWGELLLWDKLHNSVNWNEAWERLSLLVLVFSRNYLVVRFTNDIYIHVYKSHAHTHMCVLVCFKRGIEFPGCFSLFHDFIVFPELFNWPPLIITPCS